MKMLVLFILHVHLIVKIIFCVDIVDMTVTSYNIKANNDELVSEWQMRKKILEKIFSKLNSDIYCLQELSVIQVREMENFFQKNRRRYEGIFRGRDIFNQDEALAIFWKKEKYALLTKGHFWLSNFPSLPGSKYVDMEFSRIVLWALLKNTKGLKYLIINVHLDSKGKHSRYESADLIMKMIDTYSNEFKFDFLILCGDFNELPFKIFPNFKSFTFIKILNFFRTTYHEYGKVKIGSVIDFIYLQKFRNNLKISNLNYSIFKSELTLKASDHFPITLRFIN
jgi:endonuclease/exonuclease/phosphatase family metal-dependent hydrolase